MAANDVKKILTVDNLDAVTDVYDGRFAAKSAATSQADGLMTSTDKAKLDKVDLSGGTQGQVLTCDSEGNAAWADPSDSDTTYAAATSEADGLMSSSDKSALDGLVSWKAALVAADSQRY